MASSSSLLDILRSQTALVSAASEAVPYQFTQCTYHLGPVRQAVHLCLTCASPRGLCAPCAVACHGEHEQIELFPKRRFRCDCPTSALAHPCTLHKEAEPENTENAYNRNFDGAFCRCGRRYDPERERETMIQCVVCEDWFHESCCNLRERPPSREPTPAPQSDDVTAPAEEGGHDDGASDASSSDLPPARIPGTSYDAFACGACVSGVPTLRRYAGTPGAMVVLRDALGEAWKVVPPLAAEDLEAEGEVDVVDAPGAGKRTRPADGDGLCHEDEPEVKRLRHSEDEDTAAFSTQSADEACPTRNASSTCLAPPPNPAAQRIFERLRPGATGHTDSSTTAAQEPEPDASLGTGDVFLTEGWRERWCRCASCLPSLAAHPYLLDEEETYEPPEDPDSGLSLEELGMRALARLPRDRALDGIRAYNNMRDELKAYLRPFAQAGTVVSEADITRFFEARKAGQAA
ncbi:hypothetical protein PUNSTDRAFT_128198 [Punctularia strigosozonata HHB-11173 SS5]|uniref:UBR-type domain-containing protein n=1 Tax=Punctularia strigosozonata (strain HHB-11173) TaxID=741275 RepID=R7S446_PUNST|nr:uncharacterized protein PUNSTDRAFT_128198 [Punctularia strigosozonata HHB-11173 SS5]EIN04624.1 hypothetical protein PUNSTDRAFT_128198 [Punctularia strigosozonata HHB-11173 SS5]